MLANHAAPIGMLPACLSEACLHPHNVHPAPAGQAAAACCYYDVGVRASAAALCQAARVDHHHLRAGLGSCKQQQKAAAVTGSSLLLPHIPSGKQALTLHEFSAADGMQTCFVAVISRHVALMLMPSCARLICPASTTHLGLQLAGSHLLLWLLEQLPPSWQRLPSQTAAAAGPAAAAAAALHLLSGPGSCQEGQGTAERTCKHDAQQQAHMRSASTPVLSLPNLAVLQPG